MATYQSRCMCSSGTELMCGVKKREREEEGERRRGREKKREREEEGERQSKKERETQYRIISVKEARSPGYLVIIR